MGHSNKDFVTFKQRAWPGRSRKTFSLTYLICPSEIREAEFGKAESIPEKEERKEEKELVGPVKLWEGTGLVWMLEFTATCPALFCAQDDSLKARLWWRHLRQPPSLLDRMGH